MEEGRRVGRKEGKDAKEKEKKGGSEGSRMERGKQGYANPFGPPISSPKFPL